METREGPMENTESPVEKSPTQEGMSRHTLLMILCCAIPLALLAAVVIFRVNLGSIGYFGILLLCPLLHLFMMRGMRHGHGNQEAPGGQTCHGNEQPAAVGAQKQIADTAEVGARRQIAETAEVKAEAQR